MKMLTWAMGFGAAALLVTVPAVAETNSDQNMQNDQNPASSTDQQKMDQPKVNSDKFGQKSDTLDKQSLTGKVAKIEKRQVTLNADDGTQWMLKTDAKTKVFLQGDDSAHSLSALQPGDEVRAAYDMKNGDRLAGRIDVIRHVDSNAMPSDQKSDQKAEPQKKNDTTPY